MELSTTKINNELQKLFYEIFGTKFNFVMSTTTECIPSQIPRVIMYSIVTDYDNKQSGDRAFANFVNQRAQERLITCALDSLVMGIIHEIGHFYTWYTFSTNERLKYDLEKQKIADTVDAENVTIKDHYKYFRLPVELAATKFAINWAKDNMAAYIYLKDRIQSIIHDFYNEYKIEDIKLEDKLIKSEEDV